MADTPIPPTPQPTSSKPENPGVPAKLWGHMPPEEKALAETVARITMANAAIIADIVRRRDELVNVERTFPVGMPGREHITREFKREGILLDKLRKDALALHNVSAATFDRLMWRVVFEHTQRERAADIEDARKQREADRQEAEQRRKEDREEHDRQREADRQEIWRQRDTDNKTTAIRRAEDAALAKRNVRASYIGAVAGVLGGITGIISLIVAILAKH